MKSSYSIPFPVLFRCLFVIGFMFCCVPSSSASISIANFEKPKKTKKKKPKKKKPKKTKPVFDRYLTLGFGIQMGYLYAGSSKQVDADSRVVFGFNAHLRLFRSLGVTISYDLNSPTLLDGLDTRLPYPSLRLMGHLYVAQGGPMFMNLFIGAGFNFTKQNGGTKLAAYLLGGELGFQVNQRFTIVGVCRFLLPSYGQVMQSLPPEASPVNIAQNPYLYQNALIRRREEIIRRIFDFQNVQIAINFRVFL